jgi:hypothetical protein
MSWPTPADYQEAIQAPSLCFQDPDLQTGQPKLDMRGLPQVASGNFASVYTIISAKSWAVRCFLRATPDVERRYEEISKHLLDPQLQQVNSLLPFYFLVNGILVRGQWHTIVKMKWTDSKPMPAWVAGNLHSPVALQALSTSLRYEINQLQSQGVAHCDLQHGNVLVSKTGRMELVDYDGMFVPAFTGQLSPELGHANFQHPKRQPADYDRYLDNFSALVIITSLKALAEQPGLWAKYSVGENLIFTKADFLAPQQSSVFRELISKGSQEVRDLAAGLAGCCAQWPLPQEPLDTFLGRLSTFAVPFSQFPTSSFKAPVAPGRVSSVNRSAGPFVWPSFNKRFLAFAAIFLIMIAAVAITRYFRSEPSPVPPVPDIVQPPASPTPIVPSSQKTPAIHKNLDKLSPYPSRPIMPSPSIASFEVVPQVTTPCAMVILRWTVKNADSVEVEPDIGAQPAAGYQIVFPQQTTEYKIKVSGPGGSATRTALLSVTHPAAGPCRR